jgi:hypothetical protein
MSPSVGVFSVHLEGQRLLLARSDEEIQKRFAQSSPLERSFNRPEKSEYEGLTYTHYFSKYLITTADTGDPDSCAQPRTILERRKEALYVIREVYSHDHERFALRVLLSHFAGRSWQQFGTVNGVLQSTF